MPDNEKLILTVNLVEDLLSMTDVQSYIYFFQGCGGDFFIDSGIIESPHFLPAAKYTYPVYSDCVWTITTEKRKFVSLHFLFMDVASSGGCLNDYVEVRDGPTPDSPLIGWYCLFFTYYIDLDILFPYGY